MVGAAAARSLWFGEPADDTFDRCLAETEATAADYSAADLLYIPSLSAHSPYHCSSAQIVRIKDACRRRGWLFSIHLAETREEVELIHRWHGLTPTGYLDSLGVLDERTLLAHCVFLSEDDIGVLVARQAHIMHCPKSNAKLGSGTAPVPACLRRGVSLALGTDSMVSNNNLDMFEEIRFCALVHRSVHQDPCAITAAQAFSMATIDGARALGLENEIGSLRPGKRADVVLLSLCPPAGMSEDSVLSEFVFHATSEAVRTVIVNGRVLMDERRFGESPPRLSGAHP
jgi:5-methylthioadenosine/S-adenosylhomocysteine deaminase